MIKSGEHVGASELLQRIQSEALRVGQIIQTIGASRLTKASSSTISTLSPVVKGLVPLAKIICKGVNLSVETEHASDDLLVSADRTAIEQVINLVANSCEALAEVPKDTERKSSVVVSVASSDTHAIIKVRDSLRSGRQYQR